MTNENPGYSIAAPRFNVRRMRYEGGGIKWVGHDPEGDTPKNRDIFIRWLLTQNPYIHPDKLVWLDEL